MNGENVENERKKNIGEKQKGRKLSEKWEMRTSSFKCAFMSYIFFD